MAGEDAAKSGNHNARLFRISLNLEWSNSISDCQRFLKCLQVCSSWWFEDYWNLVEHQVWHYWSGRIPASWWAWTLGPDLRHLGERERGQCAFYRKVRGLEEEGEKRSNTQILRSWEKEPFSDDESMVRSFLQPFSSSWQSLWYVLSQFASRNER